MSNVPAPLSPIRLISTDFDYTLVNPVEDTIFENELIELIQSLQKKGVIWALNTGRSPTWLQTGFQETKFPILPDYTLTAERTVYQLTVDGPTPFHLDSQWSWSDVGDWNTKSIQDLDALYLSSKHLVEKLILFLKAETNAVPIYESISSTTPEYIEHLTGVVAQDEKEADYIENYIRNEMQPFLSDLGYQRNTVYLRLSHINYDKGAALGELSKVLGLTSNEVFAIGDQHNDIAMLDGKYALHVACPANSTEMVKNIVRNQEHGYVAKGSCSAGVIESLKRLCSLGLL